MDARSFVPLSAFFAADGAAAVIMDADERGGKNRDECFLRAGDEIVRLAFIRPVSIVKMHSAVVVDSGKTQVIFRRNYEKFGHIKYTVN